MLTVVVKRSGLLFGILTASAMIFFFLLMRLLNLHHIYELRYINIIILFFGDWLALRRLRKSRGSFGYLEGLGYGFGITLIASAIFTAFMSFYFLVIDPSFMEFIKQNTPNGRNLNMWMLGAILFSESISSGVIITLILMHSYKS
jgi:hypothetical protein